MEGPGKDWSPEWGKGPAAPGGQAGRARAGGGPALQAWARGDSYSDTGSAVAAATGASAAARPARDHPPPAPRAHVPPAHRPPNPASPGRSEAALQGPAPPQPPRKSRRYWDDAETFPDPRPARPPRAGAASERGTFQGSGKKTLPEYKE